MNIYYLISITILIWCIFIITTQIGPTNNSIIKGKGKYKESLSILIDRVDWSNNYNGRINVAARCGFYSVIISFLGNIIYSSKLDPQSMLQNIIIVWAILLFGHSFFTFHADKFVSYYINENLNYIRKKINVKSNIKNLYTNERQLSREDKCFSFQYKKT